MMSRFFLLPILSCLALVTLTHCQSLTPTSAPKGSAFAEADLDADGYLSPDEASDYLVTQIFRSRDENQNQKLTWEEWHVDDTAQTRKNFREWDLSGDGIVTLDEAKQVSRKRKTFQSDFDRIDSNKDGKVTYTEAYHYYSSAEGDHR